MEMVKDICGCCGEDITGEIWAYDKDNIPYCECCWEEQNQVLSDIYPWEEEPIEYND